MCVCDSCEDDDKGEEKCEIAKVSLGVSGDSKTAAGGGGWCGTRVRSMACAFMRRESTQEAPL